MIIEWTVTGTFRWKRADFCSSRNERAVAMSCIQCQDEMSKKTHNHPILVPLQYHAAGPHREAAAISPAGFCIRGRMEKVHIGWKFGLPRLGSPGKVPTSCISIGNGYSVSGSNCHSCKIASGVSQ
jgi:hypothetical protein